MFEAFYEDAKKTEALARKGGWTPDGGSFFDFGLSPESCPTIAKDFPTFAAARRWGERAIKDNKTVFGTVEVREIEIVERWNRCRYCNCGGRKAVRRSVLNGHDDFDQEDLADKCHN